VQKHGLNVDFDYFNPQWFELVPRIDVILSAVARRVILTNNSGTPTEFCRQQQCQKNPVSAVQSAWRRPLV